MDYESFKKGVYDLTYINLSAYKEKQMKRRIQALMKRKGFTLYDEFLSQIDKCKESLNEFINYLTINVSEFYRNPKQWHILEYKLIPKLREHTGKGIRIWSNACSTGEEPFTMGMILLKYYPEKHIDIIATDIDSAALEKAKKGIFPVKSLEKLDKELVNEYFTKEEDKYIISDKLRDMISFEKLNLLEDSYPEDIDIIVCRNVLIYLTEEIKEMIFKKFHSSLNDHGVLFLGSTEQIIHSAKYNFKSIGSFFYMKK